MTGIWTAPPSAEANRRRRRAAGTALLAGSLVVAGALSLPSPFSLFGQTAEEGVTVHRQPITVLQINADSGDLTVIGSDGDHVEVATRATWNGEKPVVTQVWSGSTLTVAASCPGADRCEVDLTVSIPADVAVTSRTGTGDVRVAGLSGAVDLRTETGELDLDGLSGRVTAGTDVGDITGERLRAPWITATTATGEVSLGFDSAPDLVSAVVGTGDVQVEVPESDRYRVDAATGAGEIDVQIDAVSQAPRSIEARTDTGDVSVEDR